MADDPYSKMINLFKPGTKSTPFMLGTVRRETPLEIDVQNLRQTREDLMLNTALLLKDEYGNLLDPIKNGDRVLLVTLDGGQSFIVLCKVVGA